MIPDTHVCRGGGFKGALRQAGPELRQGLVQVESRAPVVTSQVGVEISIALALRIKFQTFTNKASMEEVLHPSQ